jgi:uncharacterized protein YrzB (UPF0473 family)
LDHSEEPNQVDSPRAEKPNDSEDGSNESGRESGSDDEVTDIIDAIRKGNEQAFKSLLKLEENTDVNCEKTVMPSACCCERMS